MKTIVCGKGGCGKSAITSLIAKEISRRGFKVVVADNDESNFGLHTYLGLDLPKDLVNYFGGRDEVFERIDEIKQALRLQDVSSDYISQKGGISLLSMGKIKEYGEGCACPINALSSEFYSNLRLEDGEFLLVDAEAGIEHFGRGVEEGCDLILMVVDPTQESLRLAKKVFNFGDEIGLEVLFVLNKVNEREEGFLKKSLPEKRIISSIPEVEEISEASLEGKELDIRQKGIKEIVNVLAEFEGEN